MHDKVETRQDLTIPNFNTISYLDLDTTSNIMYACKIRSNPFSVIGFEHYEMKSFDFSSGDDLDGAGWILQHIARWRELDTSSCVLVPEHVSMFPWSQMFMCFARRVGPSANSREIVSMCGPANRYYLTPIDKAVKLFKILSSESEIKKKLEKLPVDKDAAATVPMKDMWDWQTVLIISHLYCWGMVSQVREPSGRDILVF